MGAGAAGEGATAGRMKGPLAWVVPRALGKGTAFALMYLSYVFFYFDRKNYAFWLNELTRTVGRSKEEVSVFGSVMEMAYGAGKLVAGPLVDSTPPSVVLWSTLALASGSNALMFQSSSHALDLSLWAVNGVVQSAAWPALAAIFMNWFQDSPNRGIWYSVLSTNQNVGSALTPVLLTPLVALYGWRAATVAPGLAGLAFAAILLLFTQEYPHEHYESGGSGRAGDASALKEASKAAPKAPKVPAQSWSATLLAMMTDVNLLSLGLGYAFLTAVRVGVQDWSLIFLQELRGVKLEVARDCMVALELGGFAGGIVAGAVSDRLFAGRRGPAIVLFQAAIAPVIAGVAWAPLGPDVLRAGLAGLYFLFGFFSFGPHMLVGLTAREVFPQAPSTAGSFTKSLAQVGGTLAGYPLSLVASNMGWASVAMTWVSCSLLGAVCFAPLLLVPAYHTASKSKAA